MDRVEKSKKKRPRVDQSAQRSDAVDSPPVVIAIVPKKVGEPRENLERRAKWFNSRSGGK